MNKKETAQVDLFAEDKPKYTEEQKTFVDTKSKSSIILAATAGSGKTYSCVERLKKLLERGVDPSKIIFFSFTKAATDELKKRVGNDDIKITTIHAFCMHILYRASKNKKVVTFFDFIDWFRKKHRPSSKKGPQVIREYNDMVERLYDEADQLSSAISSFKLQSADNVKGRLPSFYAQYIQFQRETRTRDFSDMLIEVFKLFKEDKWLKMFKNKYDYIFVDEYQDTSSIQLKILLSLNAKYYYLVGDENQAIYNYAGSNCVLLENMLKDRREVEKMTLSVNFRSDTDIIDNSNQYSSLKAVPNSKDGGLVNRRIMLTLDELIEVLRQKDETAVLVRTNAVIKKMEKELLLNKIPMRYFNWISDAEIDNYKKGVINPRTKSKFNELKPAFDKAADIVAFIEMNKNSNKHITTIHKSKGKEYDVCVVVNSVSPEILEENGFLHSFTNKELSKISFGFKDDEGEEPRNVHYVAVSRGKHKLYFMVYD